MPDVGVEVPQFESFYTVPFFLEGSNHLSGHTTIFCFMVLSATTIFLQHKKGFFSNKSTLNILYFFVYLGTFVVLRCTYLCYLMLHCTNVVLLYILAVLDYNNLDIRFGLVVCICFFIT